MRSAKPISRCLRTRSPARKRMPAVIWAQKWASSASGCVLVHA